MGCHHPGSPPPELLDQHYLIRHGILGQDTDGVSTLKQLALEALRPTTLKQSVTKAQRLDSKETIEAGLSVCDFHILSAEAGSVCRQNRRSVYQLTGTSCLAIWSHIEYQREHRHPHYYAVITLTKDRQIGVGVEINVQLAGTFTRVPEARCMITVLGSQFAV